MADYLVSLDAVIEEEFGITSISASLNGTGVALDSSSPLDLNAGDRVGPVKTCIIEQ